VTETFLYPWLQEKWNALMSSTARIAPALLLHGPQGVGKLELARQFSKARLCEKTFSPNFEPCRQCASCTLFEAGTHPDYLILEPEAEKTEEGEQAQPTSKAKPAAQISVAGVRAAIEFNQLSSSRGHGKIIAIHPAETMNHHAANALLKTLEEPAAGVQLVLVSHHPGRLPPTIRSRCSKVQIIRPEREIAIQWLERRQVLEPGRALDEAGGAPRSAYAMHNDEAHARATMVAELLVKDPTKMGMIEEMLNIETDRLLTLLQKRALDRLAQALCGRTIYRSERSARAEAPDQDVSQAHSEDMAYRLACWTMSLNAELRFASHPLNPRLLCERILNSIPRPADK
jgi:DNA polymerase-3 subunit delta'